MDCAAANRRPCTPSRTHLRRVLGVCAAITSAAGCADLLGLPDEPHVAPAAAPEPTQTSPLGMAPMNAGTVDTGTMVSGVMPDRVSTEGGNAAMQPERDPAAAPADVGGPPPSVSDAGRDPSGTVDAAAIEPARVCGGGSVEGPNGNCYVLGSGELEWLDAAAACRERGAGWDLAAVHDAETNAFLAGLFSGEAWLGGSDANDEGEWRWVRDGVEFWRGDATGSPVNGAFNNWNSDEPNGEDDSNCVRMVATTTRWADLECEELRRALCEGPKI